MRCDPGRNGRTMYNAQLDPEQRLGRARDPGHPRLVVTLECVRGMDDVDVTAHGPRPCASLLE